MHKILNLLGCLSFFTMFAQEPVIEIPLKSQKGQLYFSWGYTCASFSRSTIHFSNHSGRISDKTGYTNNYDFTVYNVTAHDRADFNKIKDLINITIPQYVYRIGYYFGKRKDMGIELNFDHVKYIVDDYQVARVAGHNNGNYFDNDTVLDPNSFLHFEHSDGANFFMCNFLKRWVLLNPCSDFKLDWVFKSGAGIVIPRTEVAIFGDRLNNRFHVAGWIAGVETGMRMEFLKKGVFEFTTKGSYADFKSCLVSGAGNGNAKHSFFTWQATATLGLQFNYGKK